MNILKDLIKYKVSLHHLSFKHIDNIIYHTINNYSINDKVDELYNICSHFITYQINDTITIQIAINNKL